MAKFLPTKGAMRDIATIIELDSTEEAVIRVFDALVLSGHLKPFVPGWWELLRMDKRVVLEIAHRCGALPT